jgi:hypothetical protein
MSIRDIEPISGDLVVGYGGTEEIIVKDRNDITKIVEAPCIDACLDLYDKNIRTVNSGANKYNIGNHGFIGINYDSLDDVNKKIVSELIQRGVLKPFTLSNNPENRGGRDFNISVPIFDSDSIDDVSQRFLRITNFFKPQDILYGRLDYEQGLKIVDGYVGEQVEMSESERFQFAIDCGCVFDENLDCFWEEQELARKHNEYINFISQLNPKK